MVHGYHVILPHYGFWLAQRPARLVVAVCGELGNRPVWKNDAASRPADAGPTIRRRTGPARRGTQGTAVSSRLADRRAGSVGRQRIPTTGGDQRVCPLGLFDSARTYASRHSSAQIQSGADGQPAKRLCHSAIDRRRPASIGPICEDRQTTARHVGQTPMEGLSGQR